MAERQYIGARYVPMFFDNPNTGDSTWLNGVAYEALTIVSYAGNSYTSKKPVPAGIGAPNSNPEYWVSTGNFNAQVNELRQEIEAVENRFPLTNSDLGQGSVTNSNLAQGSVTNSNLAQGAVVFFGDSWISEQYEWGTKVANGIANGMGLTKHNYGVGGSTLSGGTGETYASFFDQIDTFNNDTSFNKDTIKEIVIVGGCNDIFKANRSASEIATGLKNNILKLRQTVPNNVPITVILNFIIRTTDTPKWMVQFTRYHEICTMLTEEVAQGNIVNAKFYSLVGSIPRTCYMEDLTHIDSTKTEPVIKAILSYIKCGFANDVIFNMQSPMQGVYVIETIHNNGLLELNLIMTNISAVVQAVCPDSASGRLNLTDNIWDDSVVPNSFFSALDADDWMQITFKPTFIELSFPNTTATSRVFGAGFNHMWNTKWLQTEF